MSYEKWFFTGVKPHFEPETGRLTGLFAGYFDGCFIGAFETKRAARAAVSKAERGLR